MSDWRETLARGAIVCRVQAGDADRQATPTSIEELWTPVRIHETGNIARGDFADACRSFIESGAARGRYTGEACETIVKFGAPIQFRQAFVVEFERHSRARGGLVARLRAVCSRRA